MKTYVLLSLAAALISRGAAASDGESKVMMRDVNIICVDSGLCINCSKDEIVSLVYL